MSGGEGVRNPADLTPVINLLDGIAYWQVVYFNRILDDIENVQDAIDIIDGIVDAILVDTTAIAVDVAGLDGAAMRGTDDATLQATWTDAMAIALANYTAARAGYLDELAAANLPSDIDDLLANLALDYHQTHSRTRVYPQVPSSVIQVATAAAADTWGNWTQHVPINTIDFDYMVLKVMIEQSGAAATYIIQFGYSTVDGDDPTTAQIVGEQRFKVVGTPLKSYHADLALLGEHIPANAKLWVRLMSDTGNADTCDVSIVVTRSREITNPVTPTATWPWNS